MTQKELLCSGHCYATVYNTFTVKYSARGSLVSSLGLRVVEGAWGIQPRSDIQLSVQKLDRGGHYQSLLPKTLRQ